jgi:hypothetical protein
MDIFVYSMCGYTVCIILNLERTLHPLTGVFPAGKKKRKERKKPALHFGIKIKTPTPCARLLQSGEGHVCGHDMLPDPKYCWMNFS